MCFKYFVETSFLNVLIYKLSSGSRHVDIQINVKVMLHVQGTRRMNDDNNI